MGVSGFVLLNFFHLYISGTLLFVEKGTVISHFFEERPSEIKPPLTCRVVLLLNRKIILAWESKISLVPNCLVNCLLIVCVMNLVMDRKINFVFNSANILGLHRMKTLCQPSFLHRRLMIVL